jgi:CheY-like chemotaxis protein
MAQILVVDDDPLFSAMMREDLLREGHRALVAGSAAAALALLAAGVRVDLVLTDVLMPDMDGIELIQALRISYPALPIIAVSSGGERYTPPIFTIARLLGADCVMHKPICRTAVNASIHRLLHAKPAFAAETDRSAGPGAVDSGSPSLREEQPELNETSNPAFNHRDAASRESDHAILIEP